MRIWRLWIDTLIFSTHYNPPWFVEILMLFLSLIMFTTWLITQDNPYLVLGLSFILGCSISMLVREAIAPSPQTRITQVLALLLLIISFCWLTDFIQSLPQSSL
jgi:multisubunit Na+/H+ antiporter MnhE subunit